MKTVNIFGRGKFRKGKHSGKLNVISDRIDRRKKEYSQYRSSHPREGKLVEEDGDVFVLFKDGRKEEVDIDLS